VAKEAAALSSVPTIHFAALVLSRAMPLLRFPAWSRLNTTGGPWPLPAAVIGKIGDQGFDP
jgi:hypothetical protein